MTIPVPTGRTVTLIGRVSSGRDSDGNVTFAETRTDVIGAFDPGGSSEQIGSQDLITTQPTVYLPYGTDVSAVDAVEVGGVRFEVDGTPAQWSSPFTGWNPGVVVKLKGWSG